MKDIILSGIQGSGKGTQAKLLLERFGETMKYCEMGDVLRTLQMSDNAIGNYLVSYTQRGLLIKPEIISSLRGVFMVTIQENEVILGDGVLRMMGQTLPIVQQMRDKERSFVVVNIEITEEEVWKRIAKRNQTSHRLDDADQQAIKNRIEAFYRDTVPALERLDEQGVLVRVDGMRSEAEIFADILKIVQN
ncbi:MAG: nucleoside monophosphate kinase [Candidatus Peribacteria bacterium]|jgi:adenylate kinase|nr:nucleoside monophosphate kinase [Candidatus Peribacteria bacterium]